MGVEEQHQEVLENVMMGGKTINQIRSEQKLDLEGVWVIFAYDVVAYPISIHADEAEALRISNSFGYTTVKFWKFNELWLW